MADFLDELREQVHHDTMACIGCNDCLIACPLPESRAVTIGELNLAVTQEHITAPNVVAFVTQCTQCQQCVPACPADLSRADIVLWNKMKVESVAPDRPMPLQAGEQVFPSAWTVDQTAAHLLSLPLFEDMDPLLMRRMLLSATLRRLAPNEVLFEEGRYYERLVVVIEGSLEQTTQVANDYRARLLVLDPGSFHGFQSIIGNTPEPYRVSAIEESTVIDFTKAATVEAMRESAPFRHRLESLYRDHSVWIQARSSPIFSSMSDEAARGLLQKGTLRVLQPGEVLYRQGDPPSDMYLVKTGFLRVARDSGQGERVLQYFHNGDICGASALVFDRPETTTVSANTRAEVIAIPGGPLQELLRRDPNLAQRFADEATRSERYAEHVIDSTNTRPDPAGRTTQHLIPLEGLLDEGVVQGTEVLVINTAVCTDCNNCVDACERRHGYSRLDRSGLQLDNMLFPTACRHCEDPVCLLCSVNGIVREPDGEIRSVPDNCIGCGACAERCPYGNINMHPREKPRESGLLSMFKGKAAEEDTNIHKADVKGDRIAVKCDLCAGYEDYACVSACPVGAAVRVDPQKVLGHPQEVIGLQMHGSGPSSMGG